MNKEPERIHLNELIQHIRSYVEKRLEILEIDIQEKASRLLSAFVSDGIGLMLIALAGLFVLIAAGFGIGYLLENTALGFLIVGLVLFLLGIYLFKFKRNKIKLILRAKFFEFIDRNMNLVDKIKSTASNSTNKENNDE